MHVQHAWQYLLGTKPPNQRIVVKYEDLTVGDVLKGTVRNVVDFGAFVDIGMKSDALLHISKMDPEGKFVKNPYAVVKVGQVVNVRVDRLEADRGRVSLALVSKED